MASTRERTWIVLLTCLAAAGVVLAIVLQTREHAAAPVPHPLPTLSSPPPVAVDAAPPCDRAAIERAIAETYARKQAMLPKLIGSARATPGIVFDGIELGAPLSDAAHKRVDDQLSAAEMSWRPRVEAGKLVGFGIQVGWYDSSYPGTCDPAGPCDCIGPGDERALCVELEQLLRKTWGKPTRAPRSMFGFDPSDDTVWQAKRGRRATLTAWCSLEFE